jgi:spore germination protein YaaH
VVLVSAIGCATGPRVWVFTAPWDARSDSSLVAGVAPRATIVSGWISLDPETGAPTSLFTDSLPRKQRFALVTSYRGDRFHPEVVRILAANASARRASATSLEALVRAGAYEGVVLDLEALEATDTAALTTVVEALAAAARRGGAREVAIAVPAVDTLAYPPRLLLPHVDRLLVMLYDQHWTGSAPGPVAARDWARAALATWVAAAGADRVVAALPAYGYHWRTGRPTDVVGWVDAQRLAREAGAPVTRDAASGSLRVQMGEGGEVWLADGTLIEQIAQDARALGVRRLALWRLGLEDPAIWTALHTR